MQMDSKMIVQRVKTMRQTIRLLLLIAATNAGWRSNVDFSTLGHEVLCQAFANVVGQPLGGVAH
jgi:hypothetical protein